METSNSVDRKVVKEFTSSLWGMSSPADAIRVIGTISGSQNTQSVCRDIWTIFCDRPTTPLWVSEILWPEQEK